MKLKQVVLAALVLIASAFAQSFPTVDHPGGLSSTGWAIVPVSNVTSVSEIGYKIPLTTGADSAVAVRTIAGLGTQPWGAASIAPEQNGGSAIQKTISIPSATTYRFDIEVWGRATCRPGGCLSGVLPAFGFLNVAVDGSIVTFTTYPVGHAISTTGPKIINSTAQYASFTMNLSAGNHTLKIIEVPGNDSNNHPSGGTVEVGQLLFYPTNVAIKGTCGYSTNGTNWTTVTVTGATASAVATACEAKATFTGSGRRVNWKADIIYPTAGGTYPGCGPAHTVQCELLDIE